MYRCQQGTSEKITDLLSEFGDTFADVARV